ncbi:MAG: HEAT repeat domain-containing protein [Brevinematia bacterium]
MRKFALIIYVVIFFSAFLFGLMSSVYAQQLKKDETDVIFSLGTEDTDLLIDLTYSDNYKIAEKAVYRLGQIKSKKAFDRLISIFLFSGPSIEKGFDEVILASIWSLGELGDKRALDPLIDNYDRFKSVPYRVQIIRAVGKLGKDSEKAYIFLERTLKSTDNNYIAFEIVKAFENLGRVDAVKVLSEVLKEKRFEKWVNDEIERVIKLLTTPKKEEK